MSPFIVALPFLPERKHLSTKISYHLGYLDWNVYMHRLRSNKNSRLFYACTSRKFSNHLPCTYGVRRYSQYDWITFHEGVAVRFEI